MEGRRKDFIKYRLHAIAPIELENALQKHPGVLNVAVVPVPHPEDIEVPMAFVEKFPESKVKKNKIFLNM